ncbi:hypothetical protein P175DRAFT_0496903 [Aspergillus ochraceoroseus IBT 24754]|uniref:Uncharacterized protein n=1 Tax=Aspergillus ochraceoroseus IBT 24754 TaxID=1392256 RepID=A0A2T5M5F9_9EURO|nr:uncharacterized protein P175DRAFT_0496903 [Aspergillus ochraceoroseus IBT 24754]PTU23769.1 hypothetical protein P175DRAFT_0496903 [Aspergillus ochraceoroseus IBT 24754]
MTRFTSKDLKDREKVLEEQKDRQKDKKEDNPHEDTHDCKEKVKKQKRRSCPDSNWGIWSQRPIC